MSDFFKRTGSVDSTAFARVDSDGKPFVKSTMSSGGNISLTTAASGTGWVAFASQSCDKLVIVNDTATVLEFRQDAAGVAVPIFVDKEFTILGITNANQIEVRRKDTAVTQVTAKARWEA